MTGAMNCPRQSVNSGWVGTKEDGASYEDVYEEYQKTGFPNSHETHERVEQQRDNGEKSAEGRTFRNAVNTRVDVRKTIYGDNPHAVEEQADKKQRSYKNTQYHLNSSFQAAGDIKGIDERKGHIHYSDIDHHHGVVHGSKKQHYAGYQDVERVEHEHSVSRCGT